MSKVFIGVGHSGTDSGAVGYLVEKEVNLIEALHFNLKSEITYIGRILTGKLLSHGSNFIFDLLDKFSCLLKIF